jgi:hypothetical protein
MVVVVALFQSDYGGKIIMAKVKYLTVARGERLHMENYPSFHKSGSIRGMKEKYYGKDALLVQCGSYIYKVPQRIYDMAK